MVLPPFFSLLKTKTMNQKDINYIESMLTKNYLKTIMHLLKTNYNISAEEFIESCLNSIRQTPKLLQCDVKSLFGAMMHCAQVGLKPDTSDQHCFLIPRFNSKTNKLEANFELGYKGLIEIMYRNNRILRVFAESVYSEDVFDYEYGIEPFLKHKPFRGENRGHLDAVYCTVKFDNGENVFTVVEKHELEKIQKISANQTQFSAYNNGKDVFNFMQIKVAVKKISKLLPKNGSEDFAKAVEIDSKLEGGASTYIDLPQNGNDIVEPKLLQQKANSMTSTFDDDNDTFNDLTQSDKTDKIIVSPNVSKKGIAPNTSFENSFDDISFETNTTLEKKDSETNNLIDFGDDDDDDELTEDELNENSTLF
jgi:recombination protein RecT